MTVKSKKIQSPIVILAGLFILIAACAWQANAATKALIGKIDLKAVILLHPGMRSYDPYLQAFKVDPAKVPQTIMQQKSDQHKGEIESLTAQARLLQGRIHELQRNFNREIDRISSNYLDGLDTLATGPRALKRQQYELSKNRAETSFNAKLHALGAQLSQAEERLNRLEKIAYHVGYTDPETTQKQFLAIINEIRQYTQQIANQKGIEVVLNSKSRELKALKNENPVLAPDLDYEKIFRQPFPNEIRNDSAAISGYYQNITSLAQNWLSHGSDILQPFSNQIIDNDIFIGGTDLTVEVLAAIFRTYKVDSNIGNAVIQAIYNN
jgi:AraC-like DNA-binding protein